MKKVSRKTILSGFLSVFFFSIACVSGIQSRAVDEEALDAEGKTVGFRLYSTYSVSEWNYWDALTAGCLITGGATGLIAIWTLWKNDG
jgi:hypothetical protein